MGLNSGALLTNYSTSGIARNTRQKRSAWMPTRSPGLQREEKVAHSDHETKNTEPLNRPQLTNFCITLKSISKFQYLNSRATNTYLIFLGFSFGKRKFLLETSNGVSREHFRSAQCRAKSAFIFFSLQKFALKQPVQCFLDIRRYWETIGV